MIQGQRVIPALRMTQYARSREFYIEKLGFTLEWEHRFAPKMPVFCSVVRDGMQIYLSEHRGDCEVGGQHLCPACLDAGRTKGKIQSLENHRTLYDSTALRLSLVPVLLTAPVALYLAIRYWKTPTSIIPRTNTRLVLAILFSLLQIAGGIIFFYYVIYVA